MNMHCQLASIDDKADYKTVNEAIRQIGFTPKASTFWKIVAAVIHLGSVEFVHVEETDEAKVKNHAELDYITKLLSVDQGHTHTHTRTHLHLLYSLATWQAKWKLSRC